MSGIMDIAQRGVKEFDLLCDAAELQPEQRIWLAATIVFAAVARQSVDRKQAKAAFKALHAHWGRELRSCWYPGDSEDKRKRRAIIDRLLFADSKTPKH